MASTQELERPIINTVVVGGVGVAARPGARGREEPCKAPIEFAIFSLECYTYTSMKDTSNLNILAVVGMTGSGKSVVVDYLTSMGIPKVHFGNMIYAEMAKRGIERTPDGRSEKEFREMIRATEGKDWVGRQAIAETKDLISAGQKTVVLDGLYSWTEYRLFQHEFPGSLTTIAVVAPRSLRYARLAARPERPFTPEDARFRDYAEIEGLEKGGPIAIADHYLLNDGTEDHLLTQLKAVLTDIKLTPKNAS